MRLLSSVLHGMVYPTLGSLGYFRSRTAAASAVCVITYHGILPAGYQIKYPLLDDALVSPESFRSQLRLLKQHYNVISPDQFLRWLRQQEELPERAVLLTCDDGLLNHVTGMLPILLGENLKCLFFVTDASLRETPEVLWYMELYMMLMEAREQDQSMVLRKISIPKISPDRAQRDTVWHELVLALSRIDATERRRFIDEAPEKLGLKPGWKARQLDDPMLRARFQLLRLPELRQLANAHMTIGAHTLTHPALAEQSSELARTEIFECRNALENSLGQEVWAIAYPFGTEPAVGDREYRLAEEAGYECAFVNGGGVVNSALPRFALPRIHVTAKMSLTVYEAYISGFHDALRSRFRSQLARSA
jgi:peptidoglycan/xylan/chitin deacetylase (PgdA/CDA1 family)